MAKMVNCCIIAVGLASLAIFDPSMLGMTALAAAIDNSMPADTHTRLIQIEKRRLEYQKRALELRKKHALVQKHLTEINRKLDKTTEVLHIHKDRLQQTQNKITQTEVSLSKANDATADLSQAAVQRLREIYEGQRVGLLEMLFQVDSLQSLLDRFYFQERIAELDKNLLDALRLKAQALEKNKNKLGNEKNKLGEIVSAFARKAVAIAKEKFDQEAVARKLKTQQAFYEEAERQLAQESRRLESQILEMETSHRKTDKNMAMGSGSMAMPLSAPVSSPFGWRRHPIFGVRKFHTGVDLAGPNHAAIRAADSGNVLYTGWYGGYGKVVIISHGKGMATLYAHMAKTAVETGHNVAKGDIVGYEGTTGFSTGPHLHFEVRVNGKPNNPISYLH